MWQTWVVLVVLSICWSGHRVRGQSSDAELCHRQCASQQTFYRQFGSFTVVLADMLKSCTNKCPALPASVAALTATSSTITTTISVPTTTAQATTAQATTAQNLTSNTLFFECGVQRVGPHNHRQRIVGGRTAAECEYPWMVFVSVLQGVCAGAILDRNHVLTAAHCVKDKKTFVPMSPNVMHVRAGSSSLADVTIYQVVKVTTHPQHDPYNQINDAAVLTLSRDIEFSDCQAPICLPEPGAEPTLNEECVVAGWGVTRSGTTKIMPDLQEVNMSVVDQDVCQRRYGEAKVNDRTFCAGDYFIGGRDSCEGDSGAPLMCQVEGRYVVYGIVSSGLPVCAQPTYPGIYTKMSTCTLDKKPLQLDQPDDRVS